MGLRLMAAEAAILLLSSAANAGVAEDLTAAINTCAAMTDDETRHACYDRLPALVTSLAPTAAAAQPNTPSSVATQADAPRPAAAPAESPPSPAAQPKASPANEDAGYFGGIFSAEAVPADHISATVESFTYEDGAFVLTLDNGQVWQQVTASRGLARLSRDKKDRVTIWRSSFGYDVLKIEGTHVTYHVRRIK